MIPRQWTSGLNFPEPGTDCLRPLAEEQGSSTADGHHLQETPFMPPKESNQYHDFEVLKFAGIANQGDIQKVVENSDHASWLNPAIAEAPIMFMPCR